jgi:hypothetical protein
MVSSCMMTPLMNFAASGAVKSISRYVRRLCSVERIPSTSNRFVSVPTVSSAARMPLPPSTSARAVLSTSWMSWLIVRILLALHDDAGRFRGHDPDRRTLFTISCASSTIASRWTWSSKLSA